jgi:hypothetical protein
MAAVDAATKEMEALHVKQNEETKVSNMLCVKIWSCSSHGDYYLFLAYLCL